MNEVKNEVMPIGSRVLLRLMEENPYLNVTTETGLKLTNGKFENPDSGELDQKEFPIRCAEILECGPECKFVRPGDHAYVVMSSLMPVPFRGEILFCVGEVNLVTIMNNDLKERVKK